MFGNNKCDHALPQLELDTPVEEPKARLVTRYWKGESPRPKGEGGPKGRVRGAEIHFTPHPPLRGTLSLRERILLALVLVPSDMTKEVSHRAANSNLPESRSGRWDLTSAKMKDCRWLKPVLIGHFEFTEWILDGHLHHSKFVALREDKKALNVRREWSGSISSSLRLVFQFAEPSAPYAFYVFPCWSHPVPETAVPLSIFHEASHHSHRWTGISK